MQDSSNTVRIKTIRAANFLNIKSAELDFQHGNVPDIIVMDESASHQEVLEFLSTSGIDALIPLIPVQSKALKPEPRALRSMIRELSPAFVFA